MIAKKRYKPFYKQFLRLRVNVQNRPKLFKFKKQKWSKFQRYSESQLKFFKRFKMKDQFRFFVKKFASRGNSFQKKFRNNLQERKIFSLFYGGLKKKYFKTHVINFINSRKLKNPGSGNMQNNVIQFFESKLDTVLYRSGFCLSIQEAKKLVLHKHILVNKQFVTTGSYLLKPNDLIEVSENIKARNWVKKNLVKFNFWPIPAKHLVINYKTLQILFLYNESSNFSPTLNHHLNLGSVLANIKKW
nr:ribosomal protein S4 [Nitzschia traheaformis]